MICLGSMSGVPENVVSVKFNHNGELVAVGFEREKIQVFDVDSGEIKYQLPVNASVPVLAMHPRTNTMAFAPDDKERNVVIWQMPSS